MFGIEDFEISIMKKIQTLKLHKESRLLSYPFDSKQFIIINIIFYLFNILNLKEIIIIFGAPVYTFIIKNITQRKRPYKKYMDISNYSNKNHNDYILHTKSYSFPSGHTLTSFVFSYVLFNKYYYNNLKFFLIVPLLVGFSRIFMGVHYITDVIFAFIFGYIYILLVKKCL